MSTIVSVTVEALRKFVTMLLEAGKTTEWTPWPARAKKRPYKSTQPGVGPGEQRLELVLGGQVQGGSVSFDIIDAAGRKWEVKEPDQAGDVRPGTEGRVAIADARQQMEEVIRHLARAFNIAERQLDLTGIMSPETRDKIRDFLKNDAGKIFKGEISASRAATLRDILSTIHTSMAPVTSGEDEKYVALGGFEHEISRDVDTKTYIQIGKQLDIPEEELRVDDREVFSALFDHLAFKDPDGWINSAWTKAALASTVFGHTSGVILVNPAGYRIIPRRYLDSELTFVRVSQGVPRFKAKL